MLSKFLGEVQCSHQLIIMSKVNMLIAILFLLSFSLIVSQVWAHTPLSPSDEIHSLDTAFEVPNPTKSWALYRELHQEGEADYYKLNLKAGERISLFIKEIKKTFLHI